MDGDSKQPAYYYVNGIRSVPTTVWTAHGACLLPYVGVVKMPVRGGCFLVILWTAHGACLLLCGRHTERAYYFRSDARNTLHSEDGLDFS